MIVKTVLMMFLTFDIAKLTLPKKINILNHSLNMLHSISDPRNRRFRTLKRHNIISDYPVGRFASNYSIIVFSELIVVDIYWKRDV